MKNKIPLIFDCDNTYGVPRRDVDDGLALLYLLGCPEIELLGITCSFGNSDQNTVYANTQRLLAEWGRSDIPVYRGAVAGGDHDSPAARFLAAQAAAYKSRLNILCTGSVTNLFGANCFDSEFFGNIARLSLMGGLTEPLFVGGKPMRELNFSSDSQATYEVLRGVKNVLIACAAHCLDSFFSEVQLKAELDAHPGALASYLGRTLRYWYDINRHEWNIDGIINWDVMAACQLLHPEYFRLKPAVITPSEESLRSGCLLGDGRPLSVCLPHIIDRQRYTEHIYDIYFSAAVAIKEHNE